MNSILLNGLAFAAMAAVVSAHGDEEMGAMAGTLPDDAPFYQWPEESMGWALKVHLVLCLVAYVLVLPT
ncbi:hypothetical protein GGI22_006660, partial [Coemansia erecta]